MGGEGQVTVTGDEGQVISDSFHSSPVTRHSSLATRHPSLVTHHLSKEIMKKVTAFAPGSIGNVTCGFDVLGLAIERPGDHVDAVLNGTNKLKIVEITGDGGVLPYAVEKNTAGIAVKALLAAQNLYIGIDLHIHKHMPMGSGLGSSAASAVAAVVAANGLLENPLSKHELMPFVLEAEGVASGSVHGDNAIPSLLGGIVLMRSYNPLEIVELPVPENLFCSVVHPDLKILTKEARGRIPQEVPMKKVIQQMSNIAGFVSGLYSSDYQLISKSLEDHLAEPYRVELIKGFPQVKQAALKAGALNFGISGSGPSVYSFSTSLEAGQEIGKAIQATFAELAIGSRLYVSKINTKGAYLVEPAT